MGAERVLHPDGAGVFSAGREKDARWKFERSKIFSNFHRAPAPGGAEGADWGWEKGV